MYKPYDYYDDEEQQYQMLMQQIDPNYQPNDEEIKIYAVATLGMTLPEDKQFLYLARQALKSPLPDNWNAFQDREGQVFYKHRITQQITVDHPIDIEYQRKYLQQKQKLARRGIKSINNKNANNGMSKLKLFSNIAREEEIFSNKQILNNESDLKQASLEQKYSLQIQKHSKEIDNKFQEFKFSQDKSYKQKQKQLHLQHQNQMKRIKKQNSVVLPFQQKINQHKNVIQKKLKQEQQRAYKSNYQTLQQESDKSLKKFQKQLTQDLKQKLKNLSNKGQQKIENYTTEIEKLLEIIQLKRDDIEKHKESDIRKAHSQFQTKKKQYDQQAMQKLKSENLKFKQQRQQKIRLKKQQYQNEYNKIRKLLKNSPENQIKQFIQKKTRLQEISKKKIQVEKHRLKQNIQREIEHQFETKKRQKRIMMEQKNQKEIKKYAEELQKQYRLKIQKQQEQYLIKFEKKEIEIYDEMKSKITKFEIKKNKSLIGTRQSFINEMENKKQNLDTSNQFHLSKLKIQEKQFQIHNKNNYIKNLNHQITQINELLLKYKFNTRLYKAKPNQINSILNQYIKETNHQIHDESSALKSVQSKLNQMKNIFEYDTNLLEKVKIYIQRQQQSHSPATNKLIKNFNKAGTDLKMKYLKDFEIMKQNESIIQKYEDFIKNNTNDQQQLIKFSRQNLNYKIPLLRNQFQSQNLDEFHHMKLKVKQSNFTRPTSSLKSTKRVEEMFNQHSQFLSNIKQQLNLRLSQIKGMSLITRNF